MGGAFWNGLRPSHIHTFCEKSHFLSKEMRAVCDRGAASLPRLREAVGGGSLPALEGGMGVYLEDAIAGRTAASMGLMSSGSAVRRMLPNCPWVTSG